MIYGEKEVAGVSIEFAVQYTDSYSESIYSFANTINNGDGGTHLTGLRAAITRSINDYGRKSGNLKDTDPNFSGEDTREGLTGIISIKHPDPQFESQTKVKLMNADVQTYVQQVVGETSLLSWTKIPPLVRRSSKSVLLLPVPGTQPRKRVIL
jgi:DNA gyrase subunit B